MRFTKLQKMVKFLTLLFITWKAWLFTFLFLGIAFTPLRFNFLGGGLEHYVVSPWFWSWSNFDGEHYLAIAQHGYGNGEQAFFPLYTILMKILVWPWKESIFHLQIAGLIISNISFFVGLIGLWKLVRLDYKKNIAITVSILLLVFPTSFYFGSVYTEGLFFVLFVWSFYFARRGWWLSAGIIGAFATAARFTGIVLLPALIVEWCIQNKTQSAKLKSKNYKRVIVENLLALSLIPFGLLSYMYYLGQTTGDPLAFLHTLTWFGEQRSGTPILLPQVFWRYLKILIDAPVGNPIFFTILLEVITGVLFLSVSILGFVKLRLSYALWLFLGYILPTLSGSFSSLPRYVLPLFPGFILFGIFVERQRYFVKAIVFACLFLVLGIATALFTSGYWVS